MQDRPAHIVNRRERLLPSAFGLAVLGCGAITLYARLFCANLLAKYDDDAFYYFQIARNIVTGHGSSFDGVHLTNGYHPLWMLLCIVLAWLASGKAFFALLQSVAFLSFAITFFAARSLFRLAGASEMLAEVTSSAVAFQCLLLIHGGMEITLTIPLVLVLLVFRLRAGFQWIVRDALLYGGLAVLIVLSRLDALLWVALLVLAEAKWAWNERPRRFTARLLAALTAVLPLAMYELVNEHWFHLWKPVSAAVKESRFHGGFTITGIRASMYLMDQAYGPLIVYPALLLMVCALAAIARRSTGRGHVQVRTVALTLMLFPAVQLTALCFTSDWQIWSWYLYSFALGMIGELLYLIDAYPQGQTGNSALSLTPLITCALVVPLGFIYGVTAVSGKETPHWAIFASDLQDFAQTHRGIYAMGDCAGISGYLLHQPVIQTEGLVMDSSFLEDIRQQRDLRQVLDEYGVRYYVTFRAIQRPHGCFRVEEPAKAGPNSPRMRTTLCQQPVANYPLGPVVLRVFDLTAETAR